jgi:hypothetical protein
LIFHALVLNYYSYLHWTCVNFFFFFFKFVFYIVSYLNKFCLLIFQNADLTNANLENAILEGANLKVNVCLALYLVHRKKRSAMQRIFLHYLSGNCED